MNYDISYPLQRVIALLAGGFNLMALMQEGGGDAENALKAHPTSVEWRMSEEERKMALVFARRIQAEWNKAEK